MPDNFYCLRLYIQHIYTFKTIAGDENYIQEMKWVLI